MKQSSWRLYTSIVFRSFYCFLDSKPLLGFWRRKTFVVSKSNVSGTSRKRNLISNWLIHEDEWLFLWYFQISFWSPSAGQLVNKRINLRFFLVIEFLHYKESNFLLHYSTNHFQNTIMVSTWVSKCYFKILSFLQKLNRLLCISVW